MFKVNNKNTRTTSMAYFTPFFSVSIADIGQVNVDWKPCDTFQYPLQYHVTVIGTKDI